MANSIAIGVAYQDQNIINADTVQAKSILTTSVIGYTASSFSAVTQQNNKTTAVAITTPAGSITTANAQLAPSANAVFTVTNPAISAKDTIVISIASGGTLGAYLVNIAAIADGSFSVLIKNVTNNAYAEAVTLNYAIFHVGN